jgi:protein SCO1/2
MPTARIARPSRSRGRPAQIVALAGVLVLASSLVVGAQSAREDSILARIDIEQKLGTALPLDAAFVDEHGKAVRLGDFFAERPVVIAPVYYECPMLCTLVLEGFIKALRTLKFAPGHEFDVVVLSFDPGEGPELALKKETAYLTSYGKPETADGWHFLTGTEPEIRRVTDALGFHYVYDDKRDEYAHGATLVIATPDGTIARYLFGIEFSARDLRLGLVEAAEGRIGTVVDRFLLYCYHYDPSAGRYSAAVLNIVRLGGVATVSAMLLFFLAMRRRDKASC